MLPGWASFMLGGIVLVLGALLGLGWLRQRIPLFKRVFKLIFKGSPATSSPEARFRAALEASLDAIYLLEAVRDPFTGEIVDFVFVDVNAKGEELISRRREEILGQRLCELLPINRTAGFFEKYKRVVETRIPLEEEFPISGQPGLQARWIRHQVVPVGDGILITSRNITEQVEREQALQESESRYRALYEAIPDMILEIAADGCILNCKPPRTFATLRPPPGLHWPSDRGDFASCFAGAMRSFGKAGSGQPDRRIPGVRD